MTSQQSTLRSALAELLDAEVEMTKAALDHTILTMAPFDRYERAKVAARAALQQVPEHAPTSAIPTPPRAGSESSAADSGAPDVLDARRWELARHLVRQILEDNRVRFGIAGRSGWYASPLEAVNAALSVEQQDQPQTSGD